MVFGVGCDSLPAVTAREPFGADQVESLGRQSQSGREKTAARVRVPAPLPRSL